MRDIETPKSQRAIATGGLWIGVVELRTQETYFARGFAKLNLVLASNGNAATYMYHIGEENPLVHQREGEYTNSDHQAIFCQIENGTRNTAHSGAGNHDWSVKNFERDALTEMLQENQDHDGMASGKVTQMMRRITRACDVTMSKQRIHTNKRSNYWWNKGIAGCMLSSQKNDLKEDQTRNGQYT